MKILVLAPHPFFQNRGTPIALRMLLETLAAEGHDLTVLVYPEGEEVKIPGCRFLRVKRPPLVKDIPPGFSWKKIACDVVMFRMAGRLLRHEQFDLIHAGEEAVFMARYLGKKLNIPYVYDMDSSLPDQLCEKMSFLSPLHSFFQKFENSAIQGSAGVVAVCRHLEELARKTSPNGLIQRLEDITLLPAGDQEGIEKSRDLKLDTHTCNLMYVGNLETYQGIDLLLEAFSLAYLEQEKTGLVIIGGAKTDIAKYKRKARNLGISAGVTFTGPKPVADLNSYLAQADILVSPRCKGYNTPMKIYSYMDSGKPILATAMETHTQVLDDETALLVSPVDTEMADGIMRLVRDPSLRVKLAENAKNKVNQEYTREAFDLKLKSFYKRVEQNIQPA